MNILSVDTVFLNILGYPLSYIEFTGTILYLWSAWLIAQRNMLTWPIGIAAVLLYFAIFYQIRLYSDALEQIYYLAASVYGWWYWSRTEPAQRSITGVQFSAPWTCLLWATATLLLSLALGALMSHIHLWLPRIFPAPADFPYLDALTTVMSFTAMALMAHKRTESWVYWIIVDVIGIGLYFVKDVWFIAVLYIILLVIATRGLLTWCRGE